MATATRKVHAARGVPEAASLEFRTYLDNGGRYNWEIVDDGGESLVHSACFASRDDAVRAARRVYEGACSARFELDVPKQRQTVSA
jgi:uncharacterized protein YegP (UPF0339 family)